MMGREGTMISIVKTVRDHKKWGQVPTWFVTRESLQTVSPGIFASYPSEKFNSEQHFKILIGRGKLDKVTTSLKEGSRTRKCEYSVEVDIKGKLKMWKKAEGENFEVSWTTFGERLEVPKVVPPLQAKKTTPARSKPTKVKQRKARSKHHNF